ncbi:hypothetical protein L596_018978 [Steinernema carpocapsae]|uniref:Uncharacterized protein n=1 Tax=Steinernema carpocapsae TaxID=34508 RepID=A0A4U5N6B3_STECR|nr:hypothetical protein L596_018978 [Steinernema carpocapsae]
MSVDSAMSARSTVEVNPTKTTCQGSETRVETLVEDIYKSITYFVQDVTDETKEDFKNAMCTEPLPENFNYSYALVSYFWTVVFVTSRTVGAKFGRVAIVQWLLGSLGTPAIFLLTYVLLPLYAFLLHRKTPKSQMTVSERRIVIIGFAFLLGAATEFFWSNYVQPVKAPSYYLPVVVGVAIQIIGPLMKNRLAFVGSTVGVASLVSLVAANALGILNTTYVLCTITTAAVSAYNLQLLIVDSRKTEFEMTSGHIRQLIVAIYHQIVVTIFFATYQAPETK